MDAVARRRRRRIAVRPTGRLGPATIGPPPANRAEPRSLLSSKAIDCRGAHAGVWGREGGWQQGAEVGAKCRGRALEGKREALHEAALPSRRDGERATI